MRTLPAIAVHALVIILIQVVAGCGQQDKDASIKADLATKASTQKEFLGVNFTVENGIVTLTGDCPTHKAKSTVESTAKKLYGVKDVVNGINIAPVTIGTDQLLKQGVDSILKQYASVAAITKDSVVQLTGKIERDRIQKLVDAVNTLKPRTLENKLTMK